MYEFPVKIVQVCVKRKDKKVRKGYTRLINFYWCFFDICALLGFYAT
jgi:hypothetical protein